jgi:HAMP domain-containing protein
VESDWSLTHAHLTLVVLTSLPIVLLLAYAVANQGYASRLVARRTTHRLDGLVKATGATSAGDYDARVAVEGADEVTQLQIGFNRMAGELESMLRELERETQCLQTLINDLFTLARADAAG